MERGVTAILRILAVAALVGVAVILLHPSYRATAKAMWRGEIEASPIWKSNANYYREVVIGNGGANEIPK